MLVLACKKNKTRRLEKVKSHVEGPEATVKHRWNSVADVEAKKAVASGPLWGTPWEFFDPVSLCDDEGNWIVDLEDHLVKHWSKRQLASARARRADTLGRVYPKGVEIDWKASSRLCVFRGGRWVPCSL